MNSPKMRETDWQKTLEVVVKGLVGAVLVLAGLWLLGWLFTALGALLLGIAGLIGGLLRFLIPVAIIAGIVYFVVAQLRPKAPLYSTSSSREDDRGTAGVAVLTPKPDKPDLHSANVPVTVDAAPRATVTTDISTGDAKPER
jgi:hypothetical protein